MKRPCTRAQVTAHNALKDRVQTLRKHVRAAAAHDVDGIHDLRVASRRLRAVLGDHDRYYRKRAAKPFRRRVRKITRGLGKARELDVTLALLQARKPASPKETHRAIARTARMLRELRTAESDSVDKSCALARGTVFREEYEELLNTVKETKACFRKRTRSTLRERHGALLSVYRAWAAEPNDEQLHRLRIAFKKLRYSCEIARDMYGPPMDEFIGRIKGAQELLGDWNDTRVLRDYLVQASQNAPKSMTDAFAVLERACDADAKSLIEKFAEAAPHVFDNSARAKANKLFASHQVRCCPKSCPGTPSKNKEER